MQKVPYLPPNVLVSQFWFSPMGLCMVKHLQWTLAGMCPSRTLMWSDQGLLSISKSRLKTKDDTKDETSHTKAQMKLFLIHIWVVLTSFCTWCYINNYYMMQFLMRLQVIPKVLERQGQSVCSCCVLKTCCLCMRLKDDYEERHPSVSLNSLVFMSSYSYWKNKARPLSVLLSYISGPEAKQLPREINLIHKFQNQTITDRGLLNVFQQLV